MVSTPVFYNNRASQSLRAVCDPKEMPREIGVPYLRDASNKEKETDS